MNAAETQLWVRTIQSLEEMAEAEPCKAVTSVNRHLIDAAQRLREEFGNALVEAAMGE